MSERNLHYQGVTDDAPVVMNERGAKQSAVAGRFDLIPPIAMFELAQVMEYGARKYSPRNWEGISVDDHLNHALQHIFAYMAGDRSDNHLSHLLARSAMVVERAELDARSARSNHGTS